MNDLIANLYELYGLSYIQNFSDDMYNNGFYLPIFVVMFASVVVVSAIYYYVINHPRVNRWYHWLLFNIGTAILNFGMSWIIAEDKLINYYASQGMAAPYDWVAYFTLSCVNFMWAFIVFFLFSFIIKWGSRNCKHVPFV